MNFGGLQSSHIWLGVWGLGIRVWGLGVFRVLTYGSVFRVWGLGFRIENLGLGIHA